MFAGGIGGGKLGGLLALIGCEHDGRKEEVRDWAKADMDGLQAALQEINRVGEFGEKGGEECMDLFYEILWREVDKHIPSQEKQQIMLFLHEEEGQQPRVRRTTTGGGGVGHS